MDKPQPSADSFGNSDPIQLAVPLRDPELAAREEAAAETAARNVRRLISVDRGWKRFRWSRICAYAWPCALISEDYVPGAYRILVVTLREASRVNPDVVYFRRECFERFFNLKMHQRLLLD